MDKEMEQLQNDVLESVRQMKAGKAVRTTVVTPTAAAEAHAKVNQEAPTRPARLSEREIESLRKDSKAIHERIKELIRKQAGDAPT